jgi:hypothetical protein
MKARSAVTAPPNQRELVVRPSHCTPWGRLSKKLSIRLSDADRQLGKSLSNGLGSLRSSHDFILAFFCDNVHDIELSRETQPMPQQPTCCDTDQLGAIT